MIEIVQRPSRGKLLTTYLIIYAAINLSHLIMIAVGDIKTFPPYAAFPDWIDKWHIIVSVAGLLGIYGMWLMKRWGVYTESLLIIVCSVFNLYFKHSALDITNQSIGVLIFVAVVWKPFKRMT